jgi:two-component system, cell cycle response regulator
MNSVPGTVGLNEIQTEHAALLEAIVETLPEPCFVLDREGRYLAVFGGLDHTRYHDGRPLVGKRMHDVLPTAVADHFLGCVHEALDTGRVVHIEYTLSSDDVEGVTSHLDVPDHLWFEGHIAPMPSTAGRSDMAVWVVFNVTDSRVALQRLELQRQAMQAQQVELEHLARTDPLTELLNRRSFFAEAERELEWVRRTGQAAAMIVFDLDRLKVANDTLGHSAGDAALFALAELLRAERRANDVIGRLGGDEFALVVRGADLTAGRRTAERLRAAIAALEVLHDGATIPMSASFGVAELCVTDEQPDAAVRRADAAMYVAKRLGRNRAE